MHHHFTQARPVLWLFSCPQERQYWRGFLVSCEGRHSSTRIANFQATSYDETSVVEFAAGPKLEAPGVVFVEGDVASSARFLRSKSVLFHASVQEQIKIDFNQK
ncbi:hypothetical protein [Ferrovum sp.]|uniref:hypothetical protein n=1 Tax=Ferrovum sp. TaxID=2609467 RepID=UPI0026065B4F|nr:hypothetical protein [Ferrovum sp.]